MSRLIARLEAKGLVERPPMPPTAGPAASASPADGARPSAASAPNLARHDRQVRCRALDTNS
jgi:hypothetical protein